MRPDEQQDAERRHHELLRKLDAALDALTGYNDRWDRHLPQPPIDEVRYLSDVPIVLRTYGRKHTLLFCGSTVAVVCSTPIGSVTLNANSGWNVLDLEDGTTLTTTGTAQNVLLRATDEVAPGLF